MLTRTDLKSIDTLLDKKLDTKLQPIHNDIKIIKKGVKKLQKGLAKTSDFLDREDLKTVKRVRKIEEHLGFPEPVII